MFEILYQDHDLVAINKPAGWLVHRSWLDRHEKVVIMQSLRDQLNQHVFPVHRLDRPTSGVLLFALSSDVAHRLALQFAGQQMAKQYHAIVRGYLLDHAIINYPLVEKHDKIADKYRQMDKPAQEAISGYRGVATLEVPIASERYATSRYTLVELQPQTGRKHQLRRHMKHLFHPIIGDSKYGDLNQNRAFAHYFALSRLMLHASKLTLKHPTLLTELTLEAPFDDAWQALIRQFTPL